MRRVLAVLAVVFGGAAHAQAPIELHASAPTDVAVTIYRDDLALVTETRTVDLPGGPARIVFDGVLDRVIPQSAVVRGLDREKERNFDFDGLTPQSLLWRSIGSTVTVMRTNPATGKVSEETAEIAAAGDGVSLKFANRVEALGCSGLPEKLVFQRIPDGLRARPALSTTVASAPPGRREITLSYLATGLEWRTDYVVTLNEDATRADLLAWITLTNAGEEGFANAKVGAVAGDLSRVWAPATRRGFQSYARRACWPQGTTSDAPPEAIPPPPPPPPPAPMAMAAPAMRMMAEAKMADDIVVTGSRREALGDYQLYVLNGRTDVASRQTKQVQFLQKSNVSVLRLMRYVAQGESSDNAQPTQVLLRTKNEEAQGLGDPLPRGTARVFAPASTGALYAGEGSTRDTAVGLKWEVSVGATSDVTVRETLASETSQSLAGDRRRITQDMQLELANATNAPLTIEIVQPVRGASQRISGESRRYAMQEGAPTWTITLPPNARETLTWRVRWIEG